MRQAEIGVIGGSGLYDIEGLTDLEEVALSTPFGSPSDSYMIGTLEGVRIAFLPRHGRGHRLTPSEVNYRANIFGMKMLGVQRIISVSAVGSMKEEIVPGHIVIPDQFFDRTQGRRASTFFGEGVVGHIAFADPTCHTLSGLLEAGAREVDATVHRGGTYICIEGPNFSTRAESNIYRSWGVDVIGMTNLPEARLAREAEICYATLALATDYDCWHEEHDDVTVEAVIALLQQNVATARRVIRTVAARVAGLPECPCGSALRHAIMTPQEVIPDLTREKLKPLMGKYWR